jgi:hypothetical protein
MVKKPIENGEIDELTSTDNKLIVRAIIETKPILLNILKELREIKKILKKE